MSPSQKNTNFDDIPDVNAEIDHEYVEKMINVYVNGNDMFFNTLTGVDKIISYIEFAYKMVLPPPLRHRGVDALFYLFDNLVKNETRARSTPKHIRLKPPKISPTKDSSTTPLPEKNTKNQSNRYISISCKLKFDPKKKYQLTYWIGKGWKTVLPRNYTIVSSIPVPGKSRENISLVLLCLVEQVNNNGK